MKAALLLPFTALLLSGCQGPGDLSGTVMDAATQQPLPEVRCEVTSGTQVRFTDSLGKFDVSNRTGPCQMVGKKEVVVVFSKEGYQAQTISATGSATVYLQQQ